MIQRIYLWLLLLPVFLWSYPNAFHFKHLKGNHGLSQPNVTCIIQDQDGFIWIGTFHGLNRYDAYQFKAYHYDPGDPGSLSDNFISTLLLDHRGNLWVGTSDGLNLYDRFKDCFLRFKSDSSKSIGLKDNQIETLAEDSSGLIWIGTRKGGVAVYDPEQRNFINVGIESKDQPLFSSLAVRKIFVDEKGHRWIAYWNGVIDVMSADSAISAIHRIATYKLSDYPITDLVQANNSDVWIGTQGDGLYRVKLKQGRIVILEKWSPKNSRHRLSSDIILSLMIDDNQKLWIGSEDKGIDILHMDNSTIEHIEHDPYDPTSLGHNSVWDIYQDRSGNIWIGLYAHGIDFLAKNKTYFLHFTHHPGLKNSLSHKMVNGFWEDDKGRIWIATDGGGVNIFDPKIGKFEVIDSKNSNLKTDIIVSLLGDRRGRIWLGTWTDGLYMLEPGSKKFKHFTSEKHGLATNRIIHMIEDINGGLWLATYWGGVTYFDVDRDSVRVFNKANSGLSDNYVRVIYQNPDGSLWIGSDLGLDYFNPVTGKIRSYRHNPDDSLSISKGFVHSILRGSDGTLWIGTAGGLNKFVPQQDGFVHYTSRDGLPNNAIKCILEDDRGFLWISTNNGISRFNPRTQEFTNFDVSDGLQGNEFNIRSGIRTESGDLYFGGNNGFNIIPSGNFKKNIYPPPVVITDFKIFNKSVKIGSSDSILSHQITYSREIHLSYKHSMISFTFAALNYIVPEKNQYAYILEGFDKDWNYTGNRRMATYTNLDPGKYVFRVKAANNDGVWNEEGTSLVIYIHPPFWKTWWAYLLEFLLIAGFVSFVVNYFISRQRLKNALRREHLELEKMYEMDRLKTQLFSNISHEIFSPLSLILSPLERLLKSDTLDASLKESLRIMHRNALRLKRIIRQLRDFHQLEAGELQLRLSRGDIIRFIQYTGRSFQELAKAQNIRFEITSNQHSTIAWFDRDIIDKIIYNLLSNAFKYTPKGGWIILSMDVIKPDENKLPFEAKGTSYIKISVRDNGIGIPDDQLDHIFSRYYQVNQFEIGEQPEGSGIGLAMVYELVQLYQGHIFVDSKEGEGTEFTVFIPLDEHYLEESQVVSDFETKEMDNFIYSNGNSGVDKQVQKNITGKESGHVILIVDDDPEIIEYLQNNLQTAYRVIGASDGEEALEKAKQNIPDIVVSDVRMPGMNGMEFCAKLKQNELTSHIPVILLTAHDSADTQINGLKTGADAYLTKPFNIDVLKAQIQSVLASREKIREKIRQEVLYGDNIMTSDNPDEQFLQRCIKIVEKNISDTSLNADSLARMVGMSRMQLYRKLRSLTNQTVHEFIRSIRLRKAVQLLKERRMTITQVAFEVGFNDLTYFARCFRKQYHKSPSEFISGLAKKDN